MRKSRLQKFKKRKKLILISKFIAVFYLITFTCSYLTSETVAYYSDSNKEKQVIQAGTWWDGSDLVFTGKPTQNVKACPQVEIQVQIKNNGFDMIGPTKYEVYYSEKGNPKNKKGEKVADGSIDPIKAGKAGTLTYKAEKIGTYMFKVLQRPDYEKKEQELWSEKVMVKCIEEKQEDSKHVDEKENNKDGTTEQGKESTSDSKIDTSKDKQANEEKSSETKSNIDKTSQENEEASGEEKTENNAQNSPSDTTKTDETESNTKVKDKKSVETQSEKKWPTSKEEVKESESKVTKEGNSSEQNN